MGLYSVEQFIVDLRADPIYRASADEVASSLAELDIEGDADAIRAYAAICWIIEQPRTMDEKLNAMERLAKIPRGKVEIAGMRQFTGWHD